MNKRNLIVLAAAALAALGACTKENSELEYTTYNGNNSGGTAASGDANGQGSSFTSNYAPTLTGNVLDFSIALDDADITTYGDAAESVPTDASHKDYEDYVENFESQHTVTITYADGSAAVSDGDIEGVDIATSGTDVTVTSSAKGVTYVLTGATDNGSFKMAQGTNDKKFGLVLRDLTLKKSGGAAVNIQSSKRCYLQLQGDNTLYNTGGYNGTEDQKGCIFSEGKLLISGPGTLTATSVTMHAIASDDYVWVHSGPTLHLSALGKDGIHANDSVVVSGGKTYIDTVGDGIQVDELTGNYVQKGGFVRIQAARNDPDNDNSHGVKSAGNVILEGGALQVTVTDPAAKAVKADGYIVVTGGKQTLLTTGDGMYDSVEDDTKASAGLSADKYIVISGGDLRCKSTGSGGKGIKADGTLTLNNGCTVRILTTGKRYTYTSSLHSSPKGIKSEGKMTVNGGTVVVKLTGTGDGTEAIESEGAITVNDGFLAAYSYDDAINSANDLTVNGGYLYAQGLNNDAVDANRNLYVNGGVILASGGAQPENALDAAEGYNIYINGGWLFAVGGSTAQTASGSQQASIAFSASVGGQTLGLFDSSGKGLMAVTVPSTSSSACHMTAPGMAAGSAYSVNSGASANGGTTWCGINVTGSVSGGSTLTSATAALSVGQGMGGGMPGGGGSGGGGMPGGGHPW